MRKTKEDSGLTRQAILDAAERVFCERGFAATTLDAISRAAGVTRGAFYWHFKDKAEVLAALHARSFLPQEQILAAAAETDGDPLECLLEASVEALRSFEQDDSRQRIFRIMSHLTPAERGEPLAQLYAEMRDLIRRIMQRARDNGTLHPDITPQEAQVLATITVIGLLGEWLRTGKCFPLACFGERLLRRQMKMLRADPVEPRSERMTSPPGRASPSIED